MILGLRYIDRSFVENRLITAVAAAEALHRRLLPENTYVGDTEFEQIRSAVLDAIPEAHRAWLRGRVRNEPSFKERLMQLVERLGAELVRVPAKSVIARARKELLLVSSGCRFRR